MLDPGDNSVIGSPFAGVVSTVNSFGGSVIPMDNNVELMATFKLRNMFIGLGLAYAGTTNDETTPAIGVTPASTTENSASQLGLNLGVITDITRNIKLDAAVSAIFPSASYKPPTGNETKSNQTIILVNARAFWKVNPNLRFVPILTFVTVSGTVESGGTSSVSTDIPSFTSFGIGAGLNYKIGDFLLAGGVTFSSNTYTIPAIDSIPELSNSATVFPVWNLGVEWELLDWLYGRLGYIAITGSTTTESSDLSGNVSEFVATFFGTPQRGATIGVGFRFGDFSLDTTINEDVLRQGFNIIGGGGPTFFLMTASYAMP